MSQIFEIRGIEHKSNLEYSLAGRVLSPIVKGQNLQTENGYGVCSVTDIMYFGHSVSLIEPPATCYLIVEFESQVQLGDYLYDLSRV